MEWICSIHQWRLIMKVRDLVKFLQNVDQESDVVLVASHSEQLEQNKLSMNDGKLEIDLYGFVYEEEDYNDLLGAL